MFAAALCLVAAQQVALTFDDATAQVGKNRRILDALATARVHSVLFVAQG